MAWDRLAQLAVSRHTATMPILTARLLVLAATALAALAPSALAQGAGVPTPPLPQCEFRAAWIATVDNIDWPSKKGLPTAQAQQELAAIVDQAAALHLNALVFQVRPCGDAFYRSELEPWSEWLTGEQGKAPEPAWDPLQFLLDRAHAQGLEVHAWFNPFRARHQAAKSPADRRHMSVRLPEACVPFGKQQWMDPGDARASAWSLAIVADVAARYDVDGVHLDDYFYPYPEQGTVFADDASYGRYQARGGKLVRADWRRSNIDAFVTALEQQTHDRKPFVKVGISPFGIARPGVPRGIQAGIDQYADLYADVVGWLADGRVDYLAPQLYWPIDQPKQSFAVLLPWWYGQDPLRRHIWPGLNASAAIAGKAPWRQGEIAQQIELVRAQTLAPGHVLFSWKAVRGALGTALAGGVYREAAPVPPSPWLDPDARTPDAPRLRLDQAAEGMRAVVVAPAEARFWCVQVLVDQRWQCLAVRGAKGGPVPLPKNATAVAARSIGPTGEIGDAAVLDLRPPR